MLEQVVYKSMTSCWERIAINSGVTSVCVCGGGGVGVSHLLKFTKGDLVGQISITGHEKSAGKPKYKG